MSSESSRIHILPDELINVIAAGEVVERPASVVKELVENSIDASASRISVKLSDGGRRLIQVSDDGSGMSEDEALLAIERHATSKISTLADLESLTSLGFRGEAIPSIAAVGRFVLETRQGASTSGTRITVDNGRLVQVETASGPPGTTVGLGRIFGRIPARRKFLRKRETELTWCLRVVEEASIGNCHIHFQVSENGRSLLNLPPVDDLAKRVAGLWGAEFADSLRRVESEFKGVKVTGLVSGPGDTYTRRTRQYVLINGRPVRDPVISRMISSATAGMYPANRFPALVLIARFPPQEVDFNVHPAKREVRIKGADRIGAVIRQALSGMAGRGWRAEDEWPGAEGGADLLHLAEKADTEATGSPVSNVLAENPAAYGQTGDDSFREQSLPVDVGVHVLGQFMSTYILVEVGGALRVIDQHAAHERIIYNRLLESYTSGRPPTQRLAFPQILSLSASEKKNLLACGEKLESFGFGIEDFGGGSLRVVHTPADLPRKEAESVLQELATDLADVASIPEEIALRISRWACRDSVRAGRKLSVAEMEALVLELDRAEAGFACPHGRPTNVVIDRQDLERLFSRR